MKMPKEDDKKNFHFVYICKKFTEPIIDSSDEEAVAAEQARLDAIREAEEAAVKEQMEGMEGMDEGNGEEEKNDGISK